MRAESKIDFRSHVGMFACIIIPAIIVSASFLADDISIQFLFVVPALIFFVWKWPHIALLLIPVSFMFVEGFYSAYNIILPRSITWLPDIIIILMAAKVVYDGRVKLEYRTDPLKVILLIFAAVFIVSTLINKVTPIVALAAIRHYFKYVILYWAILRLPISKKHVVLSLNVIVVLVLLQLPVIVTGYLFGLREDDLGGGLGVGGTTPLLLLCIAAASLVVSMYVHRGRSSDLIKFLAIASIPAISEIKFGFVLIPFAVFSIVCLSISKYFKRCVIIISFLFIALIGMTITYNSIYPESLQRFSTLTGSLEYLTVENEPEDSDKTLPDLGRLAQLQVVYSFFSKNMITAIIGLGPGETLDSHFKAGKGRWSDSLLAAASHNQLSFILFELGILGLLLSLWMMVWLVYGLLRLYRRTYVLEDQEIACGLFATAISLLICILYTWVLFITDATAYLFWISAAYVSLSINEIKIQKKI